jgi:fucose 4-O-acetylase-like acetyltransferase
MNTPDNICKPSETAEPVSALSSESSRATRLPWVDAAKVAGIWLMLFGHLPCGNSKVLYFIYSFHIPLFFFLSGYLEKKRDVGSTFRNSVKKILFPYFAMNGVVYIFLLLLLLTGIKNSLGYFWLTPDQFSLQECVVNPFWAVFTAYGYNFSPHIFPLSLPTWFLIVLFLVNMMYFIVNKQLMAWGGGGGGDNFLYFYFTKFFCFFKIFVWGRGW